jgi:hypothetical protein
MERKMKVRKTNTRYTYYSGLNDYSSIISSRLRAVREGREDTSSGGGSQTVSEGSSDSAVVTAQLGKTIH